MDKHSDNLKKENIRNHQIDITEMKNTTEMKNNTTGIQQQTR